ncbi:hypothetical protein HPB51_019996 [Rhipicephalus microplus]|uniref:Uncharacterized protein n=1 Tax=Rhipicephalus microplus TaxID=6941 RepID=A0A9J6E4A0_RHIMP|nr:hypothetical protein HPB51_019996 [Rhipicephalus microplus]
MSSILDLDDLVLQVPPFRTAFQLPYAKLYLGRLLPALRGPVVVLDDDVIVQGDISELASLPIPDGSIGLFSKDCDSVSRRYNTAGSRYHQLLDLSRSSLRDLGLESNECALNLGVFVVRMADWVRQNVTEMAENWIRANLREKIFKREGPLGPLLLALHNKTSLLDPQWHVRNLGVTPGSQYSRLFVTSAKLLQWSGRFKPWNARSPYSDIWHRYFVPDPTGRFRPASHGGGAASLMSGQRSQRPTAAQPDRRLNMLDERVIFRDSFDKASPSTAMEPDEDPIQDVAMTEAALEPPALPSPKKGSDLQVCDGDFGL